MGATGAPFQMQAVREHCCQPETIHKAAQAHNRAQVCCSPKVKQATGEAPAKTCSPPQQRLPEATPHPHTHVHNSRQSRTGPSPASRWPSQPSAAVAGLPPPRPRLLPAATPQAASRTVPPAPIMQSQSSFSHYFSRPPLPLSPFLPCYI